MARYYKISPRGFANEIIYLRCATKAEEVACEAEYGDLADRDPSHNAHGEWTSDVKASVPGVAVEFADRYYVLPMPE